MARPRNFIFTITSGHTGTTWLSKLLAANLPDSRVFHEILGYDAFGVDTPDVSHMTLFNSQGNIGKVQAFWEQKWARILKQDCHWYGETSHLLSKCGLLENIDLFTRVGTVYLVCIDRELLSLVRSMRKRGDMRNKGDQWLWHLDPDYPRKLVSPEFFRPYGYDGLRLWYACEMRARAAYYRQLMNGKMGLNFVCTTLESLAKPEHLAALFGQFGVQIDPSLMVVPERKNVSTAGGQPKSESITQVIQNMNFDPEAIAARYIEQGYRLGVPVPVTPKPD